jgi:hypothetical protein
MRVASSAQQCHPAPFQELNELMGFETIRSMEQRFLTAVQKEAKYGAAR